MLLHTYGVYEIPQREAVRESFMFSTSCVLLRIISSADNPPRPRSPAIAARYKDKVEEAGSTACKAWCNSAQQCMHVRVARPVRVGTMHVGMAWASQLSAAT